MSTTPTPSGPEAAAASTATAKAAQPEAKAAQPELEVITVRGTMKYEPYVFAPPAPAPPSVPPQEGQYVTNPQLNSLTSLTVDAMTVVEQEAMRHDFDRELGLSDAVVSANFPPGQQRLAVHVGVLIDSAQVEYKARIMVTQKGFCITAADTRGVHPYPYAFIYLPYNYVYTYVRCVAVRQDVPTPGMRFIPAPYPQAADALRIYTSDNKMHIIRRVRLPLAPRRAPRPARPSRLLPVRAAGRKLRLRAARPSSSSGAAGLSCRAAPAVPASAAATTATACCCCRCSTAGSCTRWCCGA